MTDYLVPLLLLGISLLALKRQEDAYDLLLVGAADGLKMLLSIVPALVVLMTAVSMLRSSGAMELLSRFLRRIAGGRGGRGGNPPGRPHQFQRIRPPAFCGRAG